MVKLGEVSSLATPRGAIMVKIKLLWVVRLLGNPYATIANFKILRDTADVLSPNFNFMYLYENIFICHFAKQKIYSI